MAKTIKQSKNKKSAGGGLKYFNILAAPFIIIIFLVFYFTLLQPDYKILFQDSENETIILSIYVRDTNSSKLIDINDKLYNKYKETYSNISFNYFDDKDAATSILLMENDTGEVRRNAMLHDIAVFLKNKDHNCLLKKATEAPITLKCY